MKNKYFSFLMLFILYCNHYQIHPQNFWQGVPDLIGSVQHYATNSVGDIFISGGCGLLKSTDDGQNWTGAQPSFYTETALAINFTDHVFSGTWGDGVYRSTDNGLTWTQINTGLTNLRVFSLVLHPTGDLYAGLWVNICRSTDNGNNWISANLPINNIVSIDVDNSGIIFAASNGNYVFKSTDDGNSWIQLYNGLTTSYIYNLSISPDGEIYVGTIGYGAFRSTDSGNNWNQAGLTGKWVYCFAFAPGGDIYAGTNQGVFKTSDNGVSWNSLDTTGLSNPYVYCLFFNSAGYLFAGTGIGLCRSAQSIITSVNETYTESTVSFFLSQNYPNPFNPSTNIQYAISSRQFVTLKVYDILGNEIATLVNEDKPAGKYEVEFNPASEIRNLVSGVYFCRLQTENYSKTVKMLYLK